MKDIMIDIETMGTMSYAAIISVAAVEFDLTTGYTGKYIYKAVSLDSCTNIGLNIEADTVNWWLAKSKEAQDAYLVADKIPIQKALMELNSIITRSHRVWGNAARFDMGLLTNAYHKAKMRVPWDFRNEMCVRTLAALRPEIKAGHEWKGIAHDPLSDCYNQIEYCHNTWKALNHG